MRSFQQVFSKICISRVLRLQFGYFKALKYKSEYFLGFPKKFPTSIPITSTLRVPPPPGILAFTPGKSLRRFRKDSNYLENFDTY